MTMNSDLPEARQQNDEDEYEGLGRNTLVVLWSIVGLFALASVLFVISYSNSGKSRIEQSDRDATIVFEDAKKRLNERDFTAAIELLEKLLADPHAIQKNDAQRLLTEVKTAVSDSLILALLIAMNDEEFDLVKTTGRVKDGTVSHPVLLAARRENIQRNFSKAVHRREEIRILEEKRRKEEKIAQERAALLRTRPTDVLNVCWGDSKQTVKQATGTKFRYTKSDELPGLERLSSDVELDDNKATRYYVFFNNKLIKVWYVFLINDNDVFKRAGEVRSALMKKQNTLLSALTEKYGNPKGASLANSHVLFDPHGDIWVSEWKLPPHTIELTAASITGKGSLHLDYTANSHEAEVYKEEDRRITRELDRKKIEQLNSTVRVVGQA